MGCNVSAQDQRLSELDRLVPQKAKAATASTGQSQHDTGQKHDEGAHGQVVVATHNKTEDALEEHAREVVPERIEKAPTRTSSDKLHRHLSTTSAANFQLTRRGVGGIAVQSQVSEHLLPEEVVFFEPQQEQIVESTGRRLIFLNTPLKEEEQALLARLHERVRAESGEDIFPAHFRPHALRLLQKARGDIHKVMEMIEAHVQLRVNNLPLSDSSMIEDLERGLIYVHGRDRYGHPIIILRACHLDDMSADQTLKIALFVCEFTVRYLLVPGRVENYVLLLDFDQCPYWSVWSNFGKLKTVIRLLQDVYCERGYSSIKLVNAGMLGSVIDAFIPSDKKQRFQFLNSASAAKEMTKLCELNQLEKRYGGTQPDVEPGKAYPYRFFENCTGTGRRTTEPTSLHQFMTCELHEGYSWDNAETGHPWRSTDACYNLTCESAAALSKLKGETVEPCADVAKLKAISRKAVALATSENQKLTGFENDDDDCDHCDVNELPAGSPTTSPVKQSNQLKKLPHRKFEPLPRGDHERSFSFRGALSREQRATAGCCFAMVPR
eukprot:TRINITY_DN92824_c0_g1_i1.p1 TRINITY_DN92824_c0_g1~~TRINITY_DN92824_c0_g1_i1.p1  ORF type:complete len:575 (-),score=91.45 TRINITY_DN92824_c0_g1_i1:144-1799(-)